MAVILNGTTGISAPIVSSTQQADSNDELVRKDQLDAAGSALTAMVPYVASGSGTSIFIDNIPTTALRVTLVWSNLSTNGSSQIIVKLGSSSGIQSTGYMCTALGYEGTNNTATNWLSSAFIIEDGANSNVTRSGSATIIGINNQYVMTGISNRYVNTASVFSGGVTLPSALTSITISTVNGTDVFDGGIVNVLYE